MLVPESKLWREDGSGQIEPAEFDKRLKIVAAAVVVVVVVDRLFGLSRIFSSKLNEIRQNV